MPPLKDRYRVVVMGAGGHGLATACHLATVKSVALYEGLTKALNFNLRHSKRALR